MTKPPLTRAPGSADSMDDVDATRRALRAAERRMLLEFIRRHPSGTRLRAAPLGERSER